MSRDSARKPAKNNSPARTPKPDLADRMIRLQKHLAQCGVASRRHAEELIAARRVTVNGKIAEKPATFVDPLHDEILVDGQVVPRWCPHAGRFQPLRAAADGDRDGA